ncbi:hypothetical protein C4K68_03250 [Pokkaliibacter plantistimulans]|uniref:Pyrroline-5-carboxylate reductase catalytic N-terminal domain-containing protein n=1 Tax=Proteobacteria bacterium 228 TaxID=2083153 RepID=A0A2S5KVS6_9PROT|nr:NAD(P)-binding domain-containing protein [Pokkaliibacter plantistimulans]PPC78870.1 hypothetical protein C4K68_03250 [Pokkaliibacter plantistimulans]
MNIGFIGVGAIAEALVHGLATLPDSPHRLILSPRNPARASHLSACYAEVHTASSNQAVVEQSDWVFITVKPDITADVLAGLPFRPEQLIINCVSTCTCADIRQLIGHNMQVFKAIPLPPVARHQGPLAYTPAHPLLQALFSQLGNAVAVADEAQLQAIATITAQISSLYGLFDCARQWLQQQGIAPQAASDYIKAMYLAQTRLAAEDGAPPFAGLMEEVSTPGGLNEQVLRQLTAVRWFDAYASSCDAVLARLRQQAD